jgi:hypothetical protein
MTGFKNGTEDGSKSQHAPPPKPKAYEPQPQEAAAAQRVSERRKARSPAPKFTVSYDGATPHLSIDHKDKMIGTVLLTDSLATADAAFAGGLLNQLATVSRTGSKLVTDEVNFVLAIVHEIGPRDPTETLLACQMAAIHNATMTAIRRLDRVETIQQQDSASNMANKLARTFVAQVEALKRYRSGGEQTVRVTHQHVNVTAGQAVVGIQGGGATNEKQSQPHVPSRAHERGPPMLGHEQAVPMPLQSAGSEGLGRVPVPRREGGSAEG